MGEDVLDLRDAEARPRDVPRALERVLDERRDELRVGRVAGAGHGDDSRVPAEHGDRVPLRVEVAAEELEEKSQEVAERVVVPLLFLCAARRRALRRTLTFFLSFWI